MEKRDGFDGWAIFANGRSIVGAVGAILKGEGLTV